MGKFLLFLLLFSTSLLANTQTVQKHVLVLHSYNKSMGWVSNIDKAINDVLQPNQNNYVLHTEYMDTKRIFSKEYLLKLKNIYKIKYANTKFDLILSSDNNAFNFLRQYRNEIFGEVPVSFSGVNNFKDSYLDGLKNFTGAVEVFDANATLKAALNIYPNAKNIFIINDYLTTGQAWTQTMKQQLKDFKQNLIFAKNSTIEELQQQIKNLDNNTIILLGVYFKDKNGTYFTYEKIGQILASSAKVPVFCLLKFNLQNGVLGGNVISGYHQGFLQSKIGKDILDGIPVEKLPVQKEGITKFIFDYESLKKHKIDFDLLPMDSDIINIPVSFYEEYKSLVRLTTLAFIALVIIIAILLLNIKKRRTTQKLLESYQKKIEENNKTLENKVQERTLQLEDAYKSITQYKHLFEQNKAVMLLIEPLSGKITDANQAALNFYGYNYDELISKNISDINTLSKEEINEEIENAKKEKRNHFFFEHKVKDNSIKSVEVVSGPITIENKNLLYSIIHDVTEHKRQEKIMEEQSKLASMGEMIGNIAHQWRQPLSIISAGVSGIKIQHQIGMLENDYLINTCDHINDNVQYLSKTIDDFKNFIKGDRTKAPFILDKHIHSFLDLIKGSIKNHDINMVLQLEENITVDGYENELVQCMINIFNNAKDALKETHQEKRYIFIETNTTQTHAIIKIKDNAEGIPKKILDRIFEPYFTTKHQSKGTGLGLHITYNLIQAMDGNVEVKNTQYDYKEQSMKGAEFTITLPL